MVTENTIGFIYSEHEKNADKFKIFGLYLLKDLVIFFDNKSGRFLSIITHIFFTSGKFFLISLSV